MFVQGIPRPVDILGLQDLTGLHLFTYLSTSQALARFEPLVLSQGQGTTTTSSYQALSIQQASGPVSLRLPQSQQPLEAGSVTPSSLQVRKPCPGELLTQPHTGSLAAALDPLPCLPSPTAGPGTGYVFRKGVSPRGTEGGQALHLSHSKLQIPPGVPGPGAPSSHPTFHHS